MPSFYFYARFHSQNCHFSPLEKNNLRLEKNIYLVPCILEELSAFTGVARSVNMRQETGQIFLAKKVENNFFL